MKTESEIEQFIRSGKTLSLVDSEKEAIKAQLLTHARSTLPFTHSHNVPWWKYWALPGSLSFASLLLIFIGTAYASQSSLPGEPLYAMKVHVVEEMIALTKIDPLAQVTYDSKLLEERLKELKIMSTETNHHPEAYAQVGEQIGEHVAEATATLEETSVTDISHEEKLETLSHLATILKAQSDIADNYDDSSTLAEAIAQAEEEAGDAILLVAEDFTRQNATSTVTEYLSAQIEVTNEYIHFDLLDEETSTVTEQHLHDITEALRDGNFPDAITSVLEAQQELQAVEYLQE